MSSNKPLLRKLFLAHNADLLDTIADGNLVFESPIKDEILCPICLNAYPIEAIDSEDLTDGHVWPDSIRSRMKSQQDHRVLLCHTCNHTSGSRGDRQMQFLKEIKAEKDKGYYRERKVQFVFGRGVKPVELNATVTERNGEVDISFVLIRNNPAEVERFHELRKESKSPTLYVPSHWLRKPQIARVGWITAAYLACFRAFGYRYILDPKLEPVRELIIDSFTNDHPILEESDTFQVWACEIHDLDEPNTGVMVSLDGETPVYVQVDFWNYHIRLPMPSFNPKVIQAMIAREVQNGWDIPNDKEAKIGIIVKCNKNELAPDLHMCDWDYVLGKAHELGEEE